MEFSSNFSFNFGENTNLYYKLLKEEDFDFKAKDIILNIRQNSDLIKVTLDCKTVLDFKIGVNALIKSLEVIDKTLNL